MNYQCPSCGIDLKYSFAKSKPKPSAKNKFLSKPYTECPKCKTLLDGNPHPNDMKSQLIMRLGILPVFLVFLIPDLGVALNIIIVCLSATLVCVVYLRHQIPKRHAVYKIVK